MTEQEAYIIQLKTLLEEVIDLLNKQKEVFDIPIIDFMFKNEVMSMNKEMTSMINLGRFILKEKIK